VSETRRIRAIVRGVVQGVSYRASTAAEGRRLGLTGWVKNRADGSVMLEAQGPRDRVDALVAWCHHGPPMADVDDVAVEDVPELANEKSFAIAY
jgi:acylphosphatase